MILSEELSFLCRISICVSLGNKDGLSDLFHDEKTVAHLEKVHETILQCYLFVGFPAAIEGFISLKKALGTTYTSLPSKTTYTHSEWEESGNQLFQKIYGKQFSRVRENMTALNKDLSDWMILEGYGKTLSRSGLLAKERELCAVASLAVNRWERQLFSHIKGALNCGATKDEIKSVLILSDFYKPNTFNTYQSLLEKL